MVFIRSYDTYACPEAQNACVADLKVFIASRDSLPLGDIQLHHETSCLNDAMPLSQLPQYAFLDVIVPMLGGKVHGSLARAGKVRGQTPKVEKKEKKKKKTGRAKRRMQYNRRFVAVVVQGPGRKRGPNARPIAA